MSKVISNQPSKIPIAITRVRKGGKLELNSRNDKQLKNKEHASRPRRTVKNVPNFKKLHKQFEAHIARGKVKKKTPSVFTDHSNKENHQLERNLHLQDSNKDEVTFVSIPSVSMVAKDTTEHHHGEDFMLRFKELCEQLQNGYHRQPLPRKSTQNDKQQLRELEDGDVDFKSLAERATYSQHRKYTMRHRPVVSPGLTRGMQEASEVLLRSVKHLYEPRYRDYHLLNDVRANLSDQLDRCNDKVTVSDSNSMQQWKSRTTMLL